MCGIGLVVLVVVHLPRCTMILSSDMRAFRYERSAAGLIILTATTVADSQGTIPTASPFTTWCRLVN